MTKQIYFLFKLESLGRAKLQIRSGIYQSYLIDFARCDWTNGKYWHYPEASNDFFNPRLYQVTSSNAFSATLVIQY